MKNTLMVYLSGELSGGLRGECREARRKGDLGVLDAAGTRLGSMESAEQLDADELADLAVDELTEITGQSADEAKALIMKAREHWFTGAGASQE